MRSALLPSVSTRRALRADLSASLVVFLVALPLCVGIAVASGVPAELGLVTGVVGGLLVGLLPGSSLQVSGPAAGLTVLVAEAVDRYGLAGLGTIVLLAGLLQIGLGLFRLGRWFRAISVAVVQGMLAGIGLLLIVGQLHVLAGGVAPHSGVGALAGLPELAGSLGASATARLALGVGVATMAVMLLWDALPGRLRVVPGALVAVVAAAGVTAVFGLPVDTIRVTGLFEVVQPSFGHWGDLADLGMLATVATFTLVASAESLFSAAAVDRLHQGPRTDFDRELVAQGAGNTVCGLLGALPMTAVIVRSSANVRAGARTKASRVLHGLWLLLFTAAVPDLIGLIPLPALAAVLVHAGVKLLPVGALPPLWREHRGEAVILTVTATAIVTTDMFTGVLVGLGLSVVKAAWETSHVRVTVHDGRPGPIEVTISGNATFLRLPTILPTLNGLPADRTVRLDLRGLRHADLACRTALDTWIATHNASADVPVQIVSPRPAGDGPVRRVASGPPSGSAADRS
ncbi:SulP family inorganic anion transporter [Micromonospora sp. WMMD882]|uniref:SulP family inorganic anion transporter n=1 Tax=Micromonospora sp. WMMD882 TaxID=3015151 RepID=UPI00248C2700|nr:SulP family inorganic anion transporter [Micromonospora sp. WMMD882]WBB80538.1 SulP family inorganic anion transporter [Micromonospora sp. WMMD882]